MKTNSGIRWGRIIAAAVMSEVAVILLLAAVMTTYRFLIAPGRSAEEYQVFNDRASYDVAPAAAGVAAFLFALWATRKLSSGFVSNAVMVGVAGVVLSGGFVFVAKPEDRLMYGVSFVLRILGGYLAGVLAQRTATRRSPSPLAA